MKGFLAKIYSIRWMFPTTVGTIFSNGSPETRDSTSDFESVGICATFSERKSSAIGYPFVPKYRFDDNSIAEEVKVTGKGHTLRFISSLTHFNAIVLDRKGSRQQSGSCISSDYSNMF